MGRGGIIFKKKRTAPARYKIGQVVYGHNDGPGAFHNYKNTLQKVKILSAVHGTYTAQIAHFEGEGSVGFYLEDELSTKEEKYLNVGTHVEFCWKGPRHVVGGKREVIPDASETWSSLILKA